MITGSLHVWPSSVERCSRMFADPELPAVAGVPAYAARNVPRGPPLGVQPIPVWLPVPVKTGGPSAVTDHVRPRSVERATSCGRASPPVPETLYLEVDWAPDTASTTPSWATIQGPPK